jgi:signal transduction histidine kinase
MDIEILEQINKAALHFLQPLTPEATYKTIIEEALKLVQGDEGYIALAEDDELKIAYAYPLELGNIKMRKRGFSYSSYKERKAFVTYPEDFKDVHPELINAGIRSTIFIPLSNRDKSIGVMNIMSRHRTRRFSNKELSILKLFGSMVSMAIRKTQLYSEVKSALDARDLFLSMAAHEFRTPITTISGYAQLLKSKMKQESSEKRWVEEIFRETQRLTRLVNELLEINRIRTGQLQYNWHETDISELLSKVVEGFRVSHPDRQINFKKELVGVGTLIVGDADKLTQVFINILDNAAKFSPLDKPIDVSLAKKYEGLAIRFKDYGHGIAQKDIHKVFEGFYRGVNNSKEGMGLGLFISYQIVKEHKGEVFVKSKLEKGTIIEVRLPKTAIKRD